MKIIFSLLFLVPIVVYCQPEEGGNKDSALNARRTDSIVSYQAKKRDSIVIIQAQADTDLIRQQFSNNVNTILAIQKENKERQKKAAIRRIAFGAGLLILLIVGLSRRRKK
ncbi:MAG: hypothetical protein JNM19_05610 [Chitinophagaceae bacterium]|nr:hypothetical protein [Chitinophagaceae bacterium]